MFDQNHNIFDHEAGLRIFYSRSLRWAAYGAIFVIRWSLKENFIVHACGAASADRSCIMLKSIDWLESHIQKRCYIA